MGLQEKRALKTFQEGAYETHKKNISEIAGFDVPVEVNWEELAEDGMSHLYDEAWPSVYFKPVEEGLTSICSDDMGKEAIKEGLKKVTLCNCGKNVSPSAGVSFEGGELKVDLPPFSNLDYMQDRVEAIVKVLENGL